MTGESRFFGTLPPDLAIIELRPHQFQATTHTLDAVILVKGRVRLILDREETVIGPGDVVIQRATNHASAVDGDEPTLFVPVLVDRT